MSAVLRLALAASFCACVTFHDRAGVPVDFARAERIVPGTTTKAEVLALLGPPTGVFDTNLLGVVTRLGETFEAPATPGSLDDDVFTWQEIEVSATIAFFPVLFAYGKSSIRSRIVTVFFGEDDRVADVAWREDLP